MRFQGRDMAKTIDNTGFFEGAMPDRAWADGRAGRPLEAVAREMQPPQAYDEQMDTNSRFVCRNLVYRWHARIRHDQLSAASLPRRRQGGSAN